MSIWVRIGAMLTTPLLLAGCFLVPGKFDSRLDIGVGGAFSFAYKGEVVFALPDEMDRRRTAVPERFDETNQTCWGPPPPAGAGPMKRPAAYAADKGPRIVTTVPIAPPPPPVMAPAPAGSRPCTRAEMIERRAAFEQAKAATDARRKREAEQLSRIIGFDPSDDESMRAFAVQLQKQAGWRSVVYKGGGVFQVDYAVQSTLSHDFVFPLLPRTTTIQPFVILRRRADGAVLVTAPGYVATGPASLMGMLGGMGDARPTKPHGLPVPTGTFTVTTGGEALTNNTEDGGVRAGDATILTWRVAAGSDKVPEALIRPR